MERMINQTELQRENKIENITDMIIQLGAIATNVEKHMGTLSLELETMGTSVEEELAKRGPAYRGEA